MRLAITLQLLADLLTIRHRRQRSHKDNKNSCKNGSELELHFVHHYYFSSLHSDVNNLFKQRPVSVPAEAKCQSGSWLKSKLCMFIV